MSMEIDQLVQMTKKALSISHEVLESLGKRGITEVHDEHVTDISTEGDMAVSHALIKFFKEQKIPAVLFSEESGRIELMEDPKYTIAFDDIDGTYNYFRGKEVLPYCTLVCIFDSPNPKFENALVAGVIEHTSEKVWHAVRNQGCYLGDVRVKTSGKKTLDRRTLVIIDHYASDISKLLPLYSKSWIKDFGSAAFHLAGVGSGLFDAYLNTTQKGHELGAGYLLIKESGGFMGDLEGNPLDKITYDFFKEYAIVAAATSELAREILSKIKH